MYSEKCEIADFKYWYHHWKHYLLLYFYLKKCHSKYGFLVTRNQILLYFNFLLVLDFLLCCFSISSSSLSLPSSSWLSVWSSSSSSSSSSSFGLLFLLLLLFEKATYLLFLIDVILIVFICNFLLVKWYINFIYWNR